MRVVAISVVKNEVDIVEAFVRHNLASLDHLVVLDNGSTDGTRQILQHLVNEGLPLQVLDTPTPGHYQWQRMTHLMREHALERHRADWVVPLDADEFLAGPPLKSLLAAADNRPYCLYWRTYVPDASDSPEETNPVRRIRQRLKNEGQLCVKVVVPAALGTQPGVQLAQGSHYLAHEGRVVPPNVGGDGLLAHYPGRSFDQFASKTAMKHMQYLAMGSENHYKGPATLLRQDRSRFDAAFRDTILRYRLCDDRPFDPEVVMDPLVYRGGELRYTPANCGERLISDLWDYTADLARRHARLTADIDERDAVIHALRNALQSDMAIRWFWLLRAGLVAPSRWMQRWLRREQLVKVLPRSILGSLRWMKRRLRPAPAPYG